VLPSAIVQKFYSPFERIIKFAMKLSITTISINLLSIMILSIRLLSMPSKPAREKAFETDRQTMSLIYDIVSLSILATKP
jgi:hypothetical protein